MATCSIPNCEKTAFARGWCPMHYQRWRKSGDPGEAAPTRLAGSRVCTIDGCGKPVFNSSEWCSMHYSRWKRNGDPLALTTNRANPGTPAWNKLARKGWDEVEHRPDLGPCWEFRGTRTKRGYGQTTDSTGTRVLAHRVSFEHHRRRLRAGEIVMHDCDNPPCINPSHLAAGTHGDNTADMHAKDRGGAIKTTAAERAEIARRRESGEDARVLAAEFGIHLSRVYAIAKTHRL